MNLLRSTLTLLLLLTTILLLYLYATSWLSPQCFAAWKLDDSYMLATYRGSLWLTHEHTDSNNAPCPPLWIFRRFPAEGVSRSYPASGLFMMTPDAYGTHRQLLQISFADFQADWKFHFCGFALALRNSTPALASSPDNVFRVAIIPLWLICTPLFLLSYVATKPYRLRRHRTRHKLCITCGYDLRASTDRCSECGTPNPFHTISAPASSPRHPLYTRIHTCFLAHPLTSTSVFLLLGILIVTFYFSRPPRTVYIQGDASPLRRVDFGKPVTLSFKDTPFATLLADLSRQSGVTTFPHWLQLESVGLQKDTPISVSFVQPIYLDQALAQIRALYPYDFAYTLDDSGIFHITSCENLQVLNVSTRLYDLRDFPTLETYDPLAPRYMFGYDHSLVPFLQNTISPEAWANVGGVFTMHESNGILTVTAPEHIHRQLNALLTQLRHFPNLTTTHPAP